MADNRFTLQINFTKSYVGEDGNHYLEGVASGPEVDLTDERMSPDALKSMVSSIKRRLVEFRDAHKQEWNDDLGEVVELSLDESNHLIYRSKLDMNLSGSKDLWYRVHTLGKKYGVSIGGAVLKAGMEYVADLGRQVYTYFDVDLYEISITRQAAYQYSFANAVLKSMPSAEKAKSSLSDEVYDVLKENYPARVLGWVKDADWEKRKSVSLDTIDMARRPGGRDPEKVKGIAEAIESGKRMDPVVLVDDGTEKLQIADGYHRTLAYQHLKKTNIAAYVATGLEPGGPWEKAMHDAKLNKSLTEDEETEAQTEETQEAVAAEEQSDATQTEGQEVKAEEATEDAAEQSDAEAVTTEEGAEAEESAEEAAEATETEVSEADDTEVTKALTDAQAELATLQKSLTDTQAQVDELTKSLSTKTEEAETFQKSLDETTKELETVKKSLAEKESELEKRDTRKAIVFGKFEGVDMVEKANPTPANQSPTMKRWLNS